MHIFVDMKAFSLFFCTFWSSFFADEFIFRWTFFRTVFGIRPHSLSNTKCCHCSKLFLMNTLIFSWYSNIVWCWMKSKKTSKIDFFLQRQKHRTKIFVKFSKHFLMIFALLMKTKFFSLWKIEKIDFSQFFVFRWHFCHSIKQHHSKYSKKNQCIRNQISDSRSIFAMCK